jgi:hypothetical protein
MRRTRGIDKRRGRDLEKELAAWDLRAKGYSLRAISRELDLSGPQHARNFVERGFKGFYSPKVEQRRAEADERLQMMLAEIVPVVMNKRRSLDDRLAAADRVIKIDREVRRLHGLDAPEASVQLVAEMPSKDVRQELLDRISRLAESAAASEDPQPAQ